MKKIWRSSLIVGLVLAACGPAQLPTPDTTGAQPAITITSSAQPAVVSDTQPHYPTSAATPLVESDPQADHPTSEPTQSTVESDPQHDHPTSEATPPVVSDPQADHPASDSPSTAPIAESDWKTVSWQGLQIPVPAEDTWAAGIPANERVNGLQVLAAGRIMDNPSGDAHDDQHTDHPTNEHADDHHAGGSAFDGPIYIILQTTASLDAWLDAERKNEVSAAGNRVEDATIRDMTIAGRPAKAYQRAIIGLALTEYYAVKISDDKLLWITTYNAEDAKYRRSIDQLVLQAQ